MSRDLSKIKTIDLISEALGLLAEAQERPDLDAHEVGLIDAVVCYELGEIYGNLQYRQKELEENIEAQDRREGQRALYQNQKEQEGREV